MEMDTFRGVLVLHFLSMITPQYHNIFFILWNSLSFSSGGGGGGAKLIFTQRYKFLLLGF